MTDEGWHVILLKGRVKRLQEAIRLLGYSDAELEGLGLWPGDMD